MKKVIVSLLVIIILYSLCSCAETAEITAGQTAESAAEATAPLTAKPAEGSIAEPTDNEEIQRAIAYGFVPKEVQSGWDKAITYSQFSKMAGNLISKLNSGLVSEWETAVKAALQCDSNMTRDSGMVGVYYAAEILGIADYRAGTDKNWSELHNKIGEPWGDFCNDYSLFGITNDMTAAFDGNDFGYEASGYFFR